MGEGWRKGDIKRKEGNKRQKFCEHYVQASCWVLKMKMKIIVLGINSPSGRERNTKHGLGFLVKLWMREDRNFWSCKKKSEGEEERKASFKRWHLNRDLVQTGNGKVRDLAAHFVWGETLKERSCFQGSSKGWDCGMKFQALRRGKLGVWAKT